MKRKPRNARRDRLTDWRFFIQIYLVRPTSPRCRHDVTYNLSIVHWVDDVALCYEHVVFPHEAEWARVL